MAQRRASRSGTATTGRRRPTRPRGGTGPGRGSTRPPASGRRSRPPRPHRGGGPLGRARGGPRARAASAPPGSAPSAQDLRLLAELLEAGVPLAGALDAVARDPSHRRVGDRVAAAARRLGAGEPIAAVLGAGAPHLTALLSAGERIGGLAAAVGAAADLEERLDTARRRVRAALAYPALVLLVAAGVVAVVVTTVVPQMAATFDELGSDLPLATRAVVRAAGWLSSPPALLLPAGIVATAVLRRRGGSASGAAGPRLPGPVARPLAVAVAIRVAATLLAHGVTLAEALAEAAAGTDDADVRAALAAAADRVRSGRDLAGAEALSDLLPPADRAVLAVGEARGILGPQLLRIADRRLAALERRLELVGTLAEPLLVLVVGAVVGSVVAALYLPSFRVLELV